MTIIQEPRTYPGRLPVHIEHWTQWLDALRTTDLPQGHGRLYSTGETPGYCCLGLGCEVAGIRHEIYNDEQYEDTADDYWYFGADGVTDLAPIEFIRWLGLPMPPLPAGREFDLMPDYPEGMRLQGPAMTPDKPQFRDGVGFEHASASGMNDTGMTFAQIADVFGYFGIGAVVPR